MRPSFIDFKPISSPCLHVLIPVKIVWKIEYTIIQYSDIAFSYLEESNRFRWLQESVLYLCCP